MRYDLTYKEIINGRMVAKNARIKAESDTEAIEQAKQLLAGREVTDISIWRKGDFVVLGRESL